VSAADGAGRSDRRHRRLPQIINVGATEPVGMADVAAETDRQQPARSVRLDRPLDRSCDGKEALAVGRLDQLGDDLARGLEGGVEVPARAGPAEPGEGEVLAGIALGY